MYTVTYGGATCTFTLDGGGERCSVVGPRGEVNGFVSLSKFVSEFVSGVAEGAGNVQSVGGWRDSGAVGASDVVVGGASGVVVGTVVNSGEGWCQGCVGRVEGSKSGIGTPRSVRDVPSVRVGEDAERRCVGRFLKLGDREGESVDSGVASAVEVGSTFEAVDSGVCGVEVGKNVERNRERRKQRKERKVRRKAGQSGGSVCRQSSVEREDVPEWRRGAGSGFPLRKPVGFFSDLPEEERSVLRNTRASMLAAQNELSAFRARQQLELEKSKDMTQLKKRQETQIMRQTEVNKVQVERAFASLAATGNVPGVGGSVRTVCSDGSVPSLTSGSVSPNSSVSMKEIHDMQKENLRMKSELEAFAVVQATYPELCAKFLPEKRPESVDTGYSVDSKGKIYSEYLENIFDVSALVLESDGKYHTRAYTGEEI